MKLISHKIVFYYQKFLFLEVYNLVPNINWVLQIPGKNLFVNRKQIIEKAFKEYDAKNNKDSFDFINIFNKSEKDVSKSWKSIIEKDPEANKTFPIVDSNNVEDLRSEINEDLKLFMRGNYPSLKEDL